MIRIFSIILFINFLFAQPKIDSLNSLLERSSDKDRVNLLNSISLEYKEFADIDKMIQFAVDARDLSKELGYNEGLTEAFNLLSEGYYLSANYDLAITFADSAFQIAEEYSLPALKAVALRNMGIAKIEKGTVDSALINLNLSIEIFEQLENKFESASTLTSLGVALGNLGRTSEAIRQQKRAAELFIEAGSPDKAAYNYLNLGSTYSVVIGDLTKSLEYTFLALYQFENAGDEFRVGYCNLILGTTYEEMNNFELALEYYKRSLKIFEKFKSKRMISTALNYAGELFKNSDKCDSAKVYYSRALKINEEIGNKAGVAIALNNLGECEFNNGRFQRALDYFNQSNEILISLDDSYKLTHSFINLGRVYDKLGDEEKAISNFESALDNSLKSSTQKEELEIYKNLAAIYTRRGNYKQASEVLSNYVLLSDTLFNSEKNKQIAELQTKYESDKKEKEIQLLKNADAINELKLHNQNLVIYGLVVFTLIVLIVSVTLFRKNSDKKKVNTVLENQNKKILEQTNELWKINSELKVLNERLQNSEAELIASNQTKDKFFSIVAHDLRGPISSMLGILEVFNEDYDELGEAEKRKIISELKDSSYNTFQLLENLLEWSKTQSNKLEFKPENFELLSIATQTVSLFSDSLKKKNISVEIDRGKNTALTADKNMIDSVMRNLVHNAVKFSNNGGKISIHFSIENEMLVTTVADNGIGISDKDIEKLFKIDSKFQNVGTNKEKGTGLGLNLAKDFVELHKGKIWAERNEEGGMSFSFSLPVNGK